MSRDGIVIAPKPDIPVLPERPPIHYPSWVHHLGHLAGPLVRPIRRRARQRECRELEDLLKRASACDTRAELEMVIGQPKYVLDGRGYDSRGFDGRDLVPDKVEVYAKGNCVIEITFDGQRQHSFIGYVKPSAWDRASRLAPPAAPAPWWYRIFR